jgi:hypothetical protein
MINSLIAKQLLSMLCIDEAHLFVQVGLAFQQEFALLQLALLEKLQAKASPSAKLSCFHISVTVLSVMATCNQMMVEQIETLSGLPFDCSSNKIWASNDAMHHQNVCLQVAYIYNASSNLQKTCRYTCCIKQPTHTPLNMTPATIASLSSFIGFAITG